MATGNICIFGSSSNNIDRKYIDAACETGALLAENGLDMVFGGGAVGLMGAAAEGAYAGGGRIIGVIPEKLNKPGIASAHCTELIVTRDMFERKSTMENLADAYIALPGGFGTLDEITEVLALKQLGYIEGQIVILNIDGFFDGILAQFESCVANGFTNRRYLGLYKTVSTPLEAIEAIRGYVPEEMPDKIKEALMYHEQSSQSE